MRVVDGLVESFLIIFWGALLACHLSWLPDLLSRCRFLHSDLDLRRYSSGSIFEIRMRVIVMSPRWPFHTLCFCWWMVLKCSSKAIRVSYLSLFYRICILVRDLLLLETSRWLLWILVVHWYFRHLIPFGILNIFFSYILRAWLLFESARLCLLELLLPRFKI
jgi:hypothetical protein